jgi:hypothetical protein
MSSSAVPDVPSRAQLATAVEEVLRVDSQTTEKIVQAFDDFVAKPLEANLKKLTGRDLAKRNPMIYTARGTTTVEEWVERVLADKETSAIEAHLGTWMEEVARIVSGGIKPGSGVDLQRENPQDSFTIELYAIQSAPNTKNAGGRRSDINALRAAASVLRASKRRVELNIAVLSGRAKSAPLKADPNVTVLASDEFWEKVTGIADFRARLIRATTMLSALIKGRVADEATRIKAEAASLFGDANGDLNVEFLASPPKAQPRHRAGGDRR